MASRFRVSKFKNQTLKLPDKPPKSAFSLTNSPAGASNWVATSAYLTAYLSGVDELSVASYFETSSSSTDNVNTKLLSIRAQGLTDFDFSPFHDDVLALCTSNGSIRVNRIPIVPTESGSLHVKSSDCGQFIDWSESSSSFQAVKFHPTVDSLLATVESDSKFSLFDITVGNVADARVHSFDSGLRVKSFAFDHHAGSTVLLGGTDLGDNSSNNNFTVQLYDVRSKQAASKANWANILSSADARVLYLDGPATSSPYLLTSSIDHKKHRVVALWDDRSLTTPLATCVDFQVSANPFVPLYDADTGVVYFVLKNGNYVSYFEADVLASSRGEFDVTGSAQSIPYSIKGAALAPKRCLDVMKTELNRLLLLTNQLLYPLSYHVPRKSYYDFHSDLYANARAPDCRLTSATLLSGDSTGLRLEDFSCPLVSLDPRESGNGGSLRLLRFDREIGSPSNVASLTTDSGHRRSNDNQSVAAVTSSSSSSITSKVVPALSKASSNSSSSSSISHSSGHGSSSQHDSPSPVEPESSSTTTSSSGKITSQSSFESNDSEDVSSSSSLSGAELPGGISKKPASIKPKPKPKPAILKKFLAPAKFKYLKGTIGGRELHFTNVQKICKNISPLCDPFKANDRYGLFPLGTGVGGGCNQLAVVDLHRPQRLSGAVQSHLLCTDIITDFTFDPFRENRVAVALLSGSVLLFTIYPPEEGNLNTDSLCIEQYDSKLIGHNGRCTSVQFHPLANDILASAGSDNRVLVWNVATEEVLYELNLAAEESQIFSIAWSGGYRPQHTAGATTLAVLGRSRRLSVYNVQSGELVQTGMLPYKVNNGRVCWISNDSMILVTGFNGLSERQFYLYDASDLSKGVLVEHGLDVSPSILVPTYDEDTRTLFLTGKGDAHIFAFEIADITAAPPPTVLVTPLSHFEAPTPHQAISFLAKNGCDVARMEFAKGWRLTGNSIEPFSFTVPRLNMEYFHDDLFPPTTITWSPLFSASEWIDLSSSCSDLSSIPAPERISLKPETMQNYSEVKDQLAAEKLEKSQSNRSLQQSASGSGGAGGALFDNMDDSTFLHNFTEMTRIGKEKQELLVEQISGMVEFNSAKTRLQDVEGVDPDEWDD